MTSHFARTAVAEGPTSTLATTFVEVQGGRVTGLDGERLGSQRLPRALPSDLLAFGLGLFSLPLGAVRCGFRGVIKRTLGQLPRALASAGHCLYRNVERLGVPFDPQRRRPGHVTEQGR